MPTDKSKEPSGISDAAIKGAKEGATENNEVALGGNVAFPAPSAQPTKNPGQDAKVRPAEVDNREETAEDDDAEWRRAGGSKAN